MLCKLMIANRNQMLLRMKFCSVQRIWKYICLVGSSVIFWHSWSPPCVEDANCSERNMPSLVDWKVSSLAFCCSGKRQRKGCVELPGFTHSQTECLLCAEQTPKADVSLVYFEGKLLPSLSMVTCWPFQGHNAQSMLHSSSFLWKSRHWAQVPQGR